LPLQEEAQELEASPRSVQDARRWVAQACRRLGRDELAGSAELGITELVTNAILHARPPVTVRMRGTHEHPRVEVFDGSPDPPTPNPRMTDDDELLSTVGRGLGIMAMCAEAWGAYIQPDGKIVWFEPAAGLADAPDIGGEVFRVEDASAGTGDDVELADGITVALRGLPTRLFLDFRRHYRELRRELRLLSLAHETDYPVAKHVSDLFQRSEDELRGTRGADRLEQALAAGEERIDLTVVVPPSSPDTMAQMVDLLELADQFCRGERLLSLAATPQQHQFQRWFLGEFVRQGRGEAPLAWAGSTQARRYSQSAS
jgi:anti-sigma regulatory factor (Ser/Thr protein kinase)